MKPLIFASNNIHKAEEMRALLNNRFEIITLNEAGIYIEIPEPYHTFEENARAKSTTIFNITHKDCFSEDSGLEVEALHGAPGVRSARYAGDHSTSSQNNELLLHNLKNHPNRNAQFKTVISLILDGKEIIFEGRCKGSIAWAPQGENGFGYDPIFIPEGYHQTFATLGLSVKSKISHRKMAVAKMNDFLSACSK